MIESKNKEIVAIQGKQKNTEQAFERISAQLTGLTNQIEIANQSYKSLMIKIDAIDKKKNNYTEEVRKIKDANADTKQFLDSKLPADFKRLLNDAVSE